MIIKHLVFRNDFTLEIALKKVFVLTLAFLLAYVNGFSQIKIGTNPTSIDSNAILELEDSTKGFLIRGTSMSARENIQNPPEGLLVFQKGENRGFYYYDSLWKRISTMVVDIAQIDSSITISQSVLDSVIRKSGSDTARVFYSGSPSSPDEVFIWDGREYLRMAGKTFRIYENYDSLRNDSLSLDYNIILIKDFIKQVNGKSFLTYGGLFYKTPVGSENGATLLVTKFGAKWMRIGVSNATYPEWWEVGGFDLNGKKYAEDFKNEGIQDDGDRLNAACRLNNFATRIILRGGYVYEHKGVAFWLSKGSIVEGNNAVVKRMGVTTSLSSSASIGQATIQVANVSEFRTGQQILAFSGNGVGQHSLNNPSSYHLITAISGNTISITPAIQKSIPTGGKVQIISDQCRGFGDNRIENVIFDGNSEVMNATYSWNHVNCIRYYVPNVRIQGCKFLNMPSEVISCPSQFWIEDCYIENLYGSFVHGSSGLGAGYNSAGVFIKNIKGKNICKVPASVNGHAAHYGFYSQSIGTAAVYIESCVIDSGNFGGVATPLASASDDFVISNSRFTNFSHILTAISTNGITNLKIDNNSFINCGVLNLGGGINQDSVFINPTITNNYFLNCQAVLTGVSNLNFSGNTIVYKPDGQNFIDFQTSKLPFVYSNMGFVTFCGENSRITNNDIKAYQYDSRAPNGIFFWPVNSMGSDNNVISNNKIVGVNSGIVSNLSGFTLKAKNFLVTQNFVSTTAYPNVTPGFGARISNGVNFVGNRVNYNSVLSPALQVFGTTGNNGELSSIVQENILTGPFSNAAIEVSYSNNLISGNTFTGLLRFTNANFSDSNIVGKNWQVNTSARQVLETFRKNEFRSTSVAPNYPAPNGSIHVDESTGDLYLRNAGTWRKVMLQ